MEWDKNKKTILSNVQILLDNMGCSHKWLNIRIFGLTDKGKQQNDLWRTDQKSLKSEVINSIAKVFGRSVDEIIYKTPHEKPPARPDSPNGTKGIEICGYKFRNGKIALKYIEIMWYIEHLDDELFNHEVKCLQSVLDAANIIIRNKQPILTIVK